ncbi:MAG TPA: class D sortase [Arenimonas sp.]|nr:class D sortase [Arenimonas sp.]
MRNGLNLRVIEIACWTLGVSLLLVYAGGRAHGEIERRQAIAAFTASKSTATLALAKGAAIDAAAAPAMVPVAQTTWAPLSAVPGDPDRSEWSPARVRGHAESVLADPSLPVALLRIPRVALEVPVYPDVGERNLNRGAGLVDTGANADSNGNIAIAAHRDGYFRVLSQVEVGDVIELESAAQQRRYRIDALSIVDPHDLSPLQASDGPVLTLITCYPFWFVGNAPQRYIVRAVAMQ